MFTQQTDGSYTIQILNSARTACNKFLGTVACGTTSLALAAADSGTLTRWTVTPYTPPQVLANGQYQISNLGRGGCSTTQYLNAPACSGSNDLTLSSGGAPCYQLIHPI